VLLAALLLPVVCMAGGLSRFGPKLLFLHEKPMKAFVVGLALVLFWAQVCFLSYLLALRDGRPPKPDAATSNSRTDGPSEWFYLHAFGLTVSLFGTALVMGAVILVVEICVLPWDLAGGFFAQIGAAFWRVPDALSFLFGAAVGVAVLAGCVRLHQAIQFEDWLRVDRHKVATWWNDRRGVIGQAFAWANGVVVSCFLAALLFQERLVPILSVIVLLTLAVLANWRGEGAPWLIVLGVGAHLVGLYALVTFIIGQSAGGILLAAPVGILGAALVLGWFWGAFRVAADAVWVWLADHFGTPSEAERQHLPWLFACLLLPLVLLLPSVSDSTASPAPLVLALLSGLAFAYGVSNYFIRRSGAVLIGIAVALVFVAHVQPYKMRHPALQPWYGPEDVVNLAWEADERGKREEEFNQKLAGYLSALREENPAKNETEVELRQNWQDLEEKSRVKAPALRRSLLKEAQASPLKESLERRASSTGLIDPRLVEVHPAASPLTKEMPARPLIVIVVSGGGIRSAAWTFRVLAELEMVFAKQGVDLAAHTRLITGASGGMVGAAYYVASLKEPKALQKEGAEERGEKIKLRRDVLDRQFDLMCEDFLTPVVQRAVLTDIPGWLSPWPLKFDRGQVLEQAWTEKLLVPDAPACRPMGMTFDNLAGGERSGWRPSLVFTPMMIEDGRRLIISNLDMRSTIRNEGWAVYNDEAGQDEVGIVRNAHSLDAMELFRLFPGANKRLTVAAAARMSASFPFISPAVSLPTIPRRRVVDAGYYDNYGVNLAAAWLATEEAFEWMQKKGFDRVVFIQIRDDSTRAARTLAKVDDYPSNQFSRSTEEILSPLEGLYNGRFASSAFSNDAQLALLERHHHLRLLERDLEKGWHEYASDPIGLADRIITLIQEKWRGQNVPTMPAALAKILQPVGSPRETKMLVANFELREPLPLSWYLTKKDKASIEKFAKLCFEPERDPNLPINPLAGAPIDLLPQWFNGFPAQ
jgi:hypothetical protein